VLRDFRILLATGFGFGRRRRRRIEVGLWFHKKPQINNPHLSNVYHSVCKICNKWMVTFYGCSCDSKLLNLERIYIYKSRMDYVRVQRIAKQPNHLYSLWREILFGSLVLLQFFGWSGVCLADPIYFPANLDLLSRVLSLRKILNPLSAVKLWRYLTSQSYILTGRHHVLARTWMNSDWSMMKRYKDGFLMRKSGGKW